MNKSRKQIKPVARIQKTSRPIDKKQKKALKGLVSLPLRSAKDLMEKLYTDDHFYETTTYAWVMPEDAKKLFLYGVCREVTKACIALMNNEEFLQEISITKEKDSLEKLIHGSVIDEQSSRLRKMIELLGLMILFNKKTKKNEEYRIYLSAENLNIALSRQQEFKGFYEGEIILNTQHSIDDFAKRIGDDLKDIKKENVWFLDMNKFKNKKPSIFSSSRKIHLEALKIATDDEKVALGISYHKTYSRLSLASHPVLGSHYYGEGNNYNSIKANFGFISIVCMHIMRLSYKLAGLTDKGGIGKVLGENFEKSEAHKAVDEMRKDFDTGDIILTRGTDLAEITEKKESEYGYKAYKIKYLSRPPISDHPEDWMEAQDVLIKLVGRDTARNLYEKSATSIKEQGLKGTAKEILKQSDEWLLNSIKATYTDLHKHKVLIPMLIESGQLKNNQKKS